MSDIREHVSDRPEDRLLSIARCAAFAQRETHDYLPKTIHAVEKFQPHAWVLEAVRLAYQAGRVDGRQELQKSLRDLIGARAW